MPVLPDVPSMMVPPGLSNPFRSASSIIRIAMRSLMELPGLNVSSFAKTVALSPLVIRLIRTMGVSPTASRMESNAFFAVAVLMDAPGQWIVARPCRRVSRRG
jgi:hypothetical protein